MTEDLTLWAEMLESTMESEKLKLFDRAFVLSATNSTQDAARRLCGNSPGAVIIAGRQLAGRGRHGRSWEQRGDAGLAITFVLARGRHDPGHLALAGGLAAMQAIDSVFPSAAAVVGLRWPNDVVDLQSGRKVAGVLVEAVDGLTLIGIGVNVHASADGWSADLEQRACSIEDLGGRTSRIELASALLVRLERCIEAETPSLTQEWVRRDTLQGCRACFLCDGKSYDGVVDSISPLHEISLRLDSGDLVRLAASQSTRVG